MSAFLPYCRVAFTSYYFKFESFEFNIYNITPLVKSSLEEVCFDGVTLSVNADGSFCISSYSWLSFTAMNMTAESRFQYLIFYKPYGVLSQFTPEDGHASLKNFGPFPPDVYPAGRLDADSEGLLLLTDDNRLKHRLTDPNFGHPRTYLVQVENIPSLEALEKLCKGVIIQGEKTRPAEALLLTTEPDLPRRPVPIRFRKNVPTAWIELTLREGRNRQVRKMTAAVGHPTLRLIRTKLGSVSIAGLTPGMSRALRTEEIKQLMELLKVRTLSS
jgi:23S rRNA pseudouridine2457 synthase